MTITRAPLRRLHLFLSRSSYDRTLGRQLHAIARRPNATWPTEYGTGLRAAQSLYYDSFPCTLHYYSWRGPTMAMHGSRLARGPDDLSSHLIAFERENGLGQDVVGFQDDELVHPGPTGNDTVWNGAWLMPHALFLLEVTDNEIDDYEERKATGSNVPEPYFFTVPRGLRMPNSLLLAQQDGEMFHLMPRVGMQLSGAKPFTTF